jgi:hypothetical protein
VTALATPVNAAFSATTGGTLANNTTYYYRVAAIDSAGTTLASTETSLGTGATGTAIVVNWGAVANATGYNVYGRTTGAELKMTPTPLAANVLTFTDTGSVTPSGALPTVNTTGIVSASVYVSTVATGTAPFTVSSTTNVANLNASSLVGNTISTPTQYGIAYGSTASNYATTAALTANALIKAGSSAAPSASSIVDNGSTVVTTEPITATNVTAGGTASTGPGTDTSGNVATNEIVVSALATPVNGSFSSTLGGGTLLHSHAYYYRVWAVDSGASNSCAPGPGDTLPSTETSVTTGAGADTYSVTVTWGAVTNAVGYCVAGRTTGGELLMTPTPLAANVLTFTDTGSVTPSGALPTANTTGIIQAAGLTGGTSGLAINTSNTASQNINFQITGVTKFTLGGTVPQFYPTFANSSNLGANNYDIANVYTRTISSTASNNISIFPSNGTSGWTFLGNISSAGYHLVPTAASTMNLGSAALPVATVFSGAAGGSVGFDDLSIGMTTSAMSQQTTATCTNITGMTWNIAASKNYKLICDIPVTFAATATIQFCLGGPGTPTSYSLDAYGSIGAAAVWSEINTLAQTSWGTKTTASGAVGVSSPVIHVYAGIQNGTTPSGTALTLQTAANGTNGFTVGANATCTLTQTN